MARILLIEDDAWLGMVLADLLRDAGHEVRHADNGAAGLKAFRDWPTDLVITDILMPTMDGIEIIRVLRRERPGSRIIAISDGGHSELYLSIAKQLGARRTLAKPFTDAEFLRAVREVLEMP